MTEPGVIVPSRDRSVSLINASILYVTAFFLTHLIYLFVTWLTARTFGIESVFTIFHIGYNTLTSSSLWSVDSLVIMFFAGPFFNTIVAGLFSRLHFVSRGDAGMAKLFYLYMFILGMNYSLGAFVAAPITSEETWFALAWLEIPQLAMYVIALIFLIVMIYIGSTKALFFYEASVYDHPNYKVNRQYWLLNTLFWPWLINIFIMLAVLLPEIKWFTVIILITPVFFFIPVFTRSPLMKEIFEHPQQMKPKIFYMLGIVLIISIIAIRIIFSLK